MRIVFFDTETTGISETDRLCQLAVKERGNIDPIVDSVYKPPVPISFEAMAVHHITEKMVSSLGSFLEAPEYKHLKNLFESDDTLAVAHNASFDVGMLTREGILPQKTICTYKVAVALDVDGEWGKHTLQFLRYRLGVEIEASAHNALGDVVVLEAVFELLLKKMIEQKGSESNALSEMIAISAQPMLFTTFRFGKHNGKRIEDVARTDPSYLVWLLGQKRLEPGGQADWIYSLEHYLASSQK